MTGNLILNNFFQKIMKYSATLRQKYTVLQDVYGKLFVELIQLILEI